MESSTPGWWSRHGWTVALLLTAFGISFLIRTVFMAALIQQFGPLNLYGGGSDSFYHSRVMTYIILNHHNLVVDNLLNYPRTAINPREPLFDWMNAVLGIIFAPLFGGNAVVAGAFFLDFQGPFWAALGVFPIYLIGKEVSSRRMGLIAAFVYPLLVANIDSSTFGYANYLSFYTFFILITVYGYLRTVRSAGTRRWVDSYRHPRDIVRGIRNFVRVERTAVKWAFFTGVSFGTLALAWQGYSFAVAAIIIFLIFALIVERIRRVDSFGLYVTTWIIGLVGFAMAVPYYVPQGLAVGWFGLPALVFFGALLVVLPFMLLRDQPWVVSIPALILTGAIAIGALYIVNRNFFTNIVTGQGYFVKTLVYSTVAEAQAPSIDALILGYGVVTFFLAFVGLALVVVTMVRHRFRRVEMLFVVFAAISIFLPISAAKFFFLGSAAFSLLPAEALLRALNIGGYDTLRRNVASSSSDRRSQFSAFRRSIKARHFLIIILIVGLMLPNVWYAIDAGVPYNLKTQYNQQIYGSLPAPLQPTLPSSSSNFFLGAAGTQLDTPTQYDENGYNWLATQDTNLAIPDRPAFISWWDYGFQAVAQGEHPTVADNFQNGIVPAGNFLLSQNETQAIGIMITTLLTAEAQATGQPYLPPALNARLAADGVDIAEMHNLMVNTSSDIQLVLAHPDRYLPVDPSHLDSANALYDTMAYFLATSLTEAGVVQVYSDVQSYTHWSIRYAMVDSRLFPFSGSNTGIFYAPADLTDRVIGSGGAPTAFYTLSVVGSDGKTYAVNGLPAGVTAVNYNINYLAPFYNSMIYKTFIGYSGTDVGQAQGIPGISQALQTDPIMPGWMLQHFQVVYRTSYYCPFSNPSAHSGCFSATNLPDAKALAKRNNGTADTSSNAYFQGGEAMLQYYAGQPLIGTVTLPSGAPVSQARVTVYDSWGIPHMTALTSADGAYSLVLPPGNDTVNVTTGPVNALVQAGTTSLSSFEISVPPALGLNPGAPAIVRPIILAPSTVQGFLYWNVGHNASYLPHVDPLLTGARVSVWGPGLPARYATTDASGAFVFRNVPPGVYNFTVIASGANYTNASWRVFASAGKLVNQTEGLTPSSVSGRTLTVAGAPVAGALVTVSNATGSIATTTTNSSGGFSLLNLAPGNFSIIATATANGLSSSLEAFQVSTAGQKLHTNLTLQRVVHIELTVVYSGNPVPSFPVRFTPIVPLSPPPPVVVPPNGTGNNTSAPPPSNSAAQTNSSVFFTNANGQIDAILPARNYSIYGLGLVGGQWLSGFASAYAATTPTQLTLAPLFLAPAIRLTGHAGLASGTTSTGAIQLTAYTARGDQVSTFPNTTGAWSLWLPSGVYSISAVEGATQAKVALYASLTSVDLVSATALNLTLSAGVRLSAIVGAVTSPGSSSGIFPAYSASVQVALSPNGGTVTALANASGNVSLVVPAAVAPGQSYCVSAQAFGFEPYSNCGLSPSEIAQVSTIPMTLRPVAVNVTVLGTPAQVNMTLNFTANSSTARTISTTGGPQFSLTLEPGNYRVTGWASASPSGLLLPDRITTVTIPVGARTDNVTFSVTQQVKGSGTLNLPPNAVNTSVTVHLSSSVFNVTLSGDDFEGKFFVAPGNYQVFAETTVQGVVYATLANVSVNATGVFSQPVSVQALGTHLTGTLVRPDGSTLVATVPVSLAGPGGFSLVETAVDGVFTVDLPRNISLDASVSTVQLVNTTFGPRYEQYTAVPSHPCVTSMASQNCSIPVSAIPLIAWFNGSLRFAGYPSSLDGTLRLVGPAPSMAVTNVNVGNGTFNVALLPGTYSLYATSGTGGGYLANASSIVVLPTPSAPTVVWLHSTWTETVTLSPPAGASNTSLSTIWFHSPNGASLTFFEVPYYTPVSFVLPVGQYTIQANGTGAPYGVATNSTAIATAYLLTGNSAADLTLAYSFRHTASLTVVPPTKVTVSGGTRVSFSLVISNTGNAPETLKLSGTPSYWNFTFSPANVTLGVTSSNRSASAQVSILVPAGTPVAHPTIQIEAIVASTGAVAGFATPLPEVDVLPVTGLTLGSGAISGAVISPYTAVVPFWVLNTGNLPEGIVFSVADAARLSGLGWESKIVSGRTAVVSTQLVQPGQNSTYSVELFSPAGHALPPGTVMVSARVVNGSGGLTLTRTLTVPTVAISANASSVYATGPGIGSPPTYPDWLIPLLAFVPAIALVSGVLVYRWWRTRRWSRR